VVHPRTFSEIADRKLDAGVVAVELVKCDGGALQVGEKAEMPPVRPELLLRADEAGAAHDEALVLVGAFGDLGNAVFGVVDGDPGVLFDQGDRRCNCLFPVRTAMV